MQVDPDHGVPEAFPAFELANTFDQLCFPTRGWFVLGQWQMVPCQVDVIFGDDRAVATAAGNWVRSIMVNGECVGVLTQHQKVDPTRGNQR